jgi:hypothetical protein
LRTTIDHSQKLTFGSFRRCDLIDSAFCCVEEGLFYSNGIRREDRKILERYVSNPVNVPATETFPPQLKLALLSRERFLRQFFWGAVRRGDLIVGFNLPFDLSRLAVKYANAQKSGWSLALSERTSRKTGKKEVDIERPRIVITSINSKTAFIKLSSKWRSEEWPNESRFLDLRTLTFALRNVAFGLASACDAFGVKGKIGHSPTGKVTPKEIAYCREDVGATTRLLNATKKEFDQHPIELRPDQTYSPASIAKAYLDAMNIARPKTRFRVTNKIHGIAMQAYYGGRAECRIRRTTVPVILTDFTSQYPTVNALLGNWKVLTARDVRFPHCTEAVQKLVRNINLNTTFRKAFWKNLSFFALVKPDNDILPVRTVYDGRTRNIGLNYLTSREPIWYAGPDIVASALLTGKAPKIIKAFRMQASGQQKKLSPTHLAGSVRIDPKKDDFFVSVIEQRSKLKATNKPVSNFLKVVGNSGSYGLFVQVDPDTLQKSRKMSVFSGTRRLSQSSRYVEKTGPWYFPPIASLITSGGRLLLAMLERCITDAGGTYLFCDTDSMCIVGSRHGGRVACVTENESEWQETVKALSIQQVRTIVRQFNQLNPYDRNYVPQLLKIEDINFVDSNPTKPQRRLLGYGIAAKRYALYEETDNGISIAKPSGHGLGYLFAPKKNKSGAGTDDEADDKMPDWVFEAWDWLIRQELRAKPKAPTWVDLPAMMRMTMTSPNVMRNNRPGWLAPYNFFLFPLVSDLGGYPPGMSRSTCNLIVPFEADRKKWKKLRGLNLWDGRVYRLVLRHSAKGDTVVPDLFRVILRKYLQHPEIKSLAPMGSPCTSDSKGLLGRMSIQAGRMVPIGKESDRSWEQGEDPSMLDFKLKEYGGRKNLFVADIADRKQWIKLGVRQLMKLSGLAQKPIYAILEGKPVRRHTLTIFKQAIGRLVI